MNTVLVIADDMRADDAGAMPFLHSLCPTSFREAFATTPICAPSRASLYTGKFARNHGVRTNADWHQLDTSDTLLTRMAAAGYTVGLYGKWGNRWVPPLPPGPSEFHCFTGPSLTDGSGYYDYKLNVNGEAVAYGRESDDYSTSVLQRKALKFVTEHAIPPWLLILAPVAPHGPAIPAERHKGDPVPAPPRGGSYNECDVSDKPPWARVPKLNAAEREALDNLCTRRRRTLLAVDEALANLAAVCPADTSWWFASDNGFLLGEHRLTRKAWPYEEAIRIPLRTSLGPGGEVGGFALVCDLAPTLLDYAGAAPLPGADGVSLRALLEGSAAGWRKDFPVECWGEPAKELPAYQGVRGEGYVYLRYAGGEEEFYDLAADPWQNDNRAGDPGSADALALARGRLAALL